MNPSPPPGRTFLAKILGNRQIFPVPTAAPKLVIIALNSELNVLLPVDPFSGALSAVVATGTSPDTSPDAFVTLESDASFDI